MKPIKVLILTQDDCTHCDAALALMDRLAQEYPLSVSTLALGSSEGQALAEKGGILFPPGIFVDGKPLCYGRPSEGRLRRAIERTLL